MPELALAAIAALMAVPESPATHVIACRVQRHVILCPVDVGDDRRLEFVVDTGTMQTVIDRGVVATLGLRTSPARLMSLDSTVPAAHVVLPSLRIGRVRREHLPVSACDLRAVAPAIGLVPDGILGMDVLGRLRVTIDYARSRLTIGSFGVLSHRAPLLTSAGAFPVVEAEVGRTRMRLVIDTGADGVVLFRQRGRSLPVPGGSPAIQAHTLSGAAWCPRAENRQMKVAGQPLGSPLTVTAGTRAATDAYDADGLLGVSVLSASLVSFDFVHRELSWQK